MFYKFIFSFFLIYLTISIDHKLPNKFTDHIKRLRFIVHDQRSVLNDPTVCRNCGVREISNTLQRVEENLALTTMSGYNEKTIRIVQFSGKKNDWRMWSKQFLALSGQKKYKDLLTGVTTTPPAAEAIDKLKTKGVAKQKA